MGAPPPVRRHTQIKLPEPQIYPLIELTEACNCSVHVLMQTPFLMPGQEKEMHQ